MIDGMRVDMMLTMDVIDNGEQLKVLAKTDNPYACIQGVSSVVIDPTQSPTLMRYAYPKRFTFGPYVGLGVWGGLNGFNAGVTFGFAVQYRLFGW